jgi:hypothetical protein
MPRRLGATAVVLLFLAIPLSPAWAWVADIVVQQDAMTQNRVNQILRGASLSEASEWMDCAKGFNYCHRKPSEEERAYADKNPDHHTYHLGKAGFRLAALLQAIFEGN